MAGRTSVGVSSDGRPPGPFGRSERCSDTILLTATTPQHVWEATRLREWPAEGRWMALASADEEVAFTVVLVAMKWLFGTVCLVSNLSTRRMTATTALV